MTKAAEAKNETKVPTVVRTKPARMPVKREQQAEPYALIRTAVDKGADIETLKELVALQERVSNEEARKAWHAAVSRFQKACPEIPRTKKGRFGLYAPLGNTLNIVRPFLSEEGLSVTWITRRYPEDPYPYKVCQLAHELGHVKEAECPIIVDENAGQTTEGKQTLNAMQKYGIADTYAERYSFEAIAGIASSEVTDTDGGGRTVNQPQAPRKAPARKPTAAREEPPHTVETPQAAPQQAEPAEQNVVIVQACGFVERAGTSPKGPWKKVTLTASDEIEYGTFSESFGVILTAACPTEDHPGEWLEIVWKKGRYGREIVEINPTDGPPE